MILKSFLSVKPQSLTSNSKTPIYRGFWGKENIHGKSGFAVNRGFVCFHYSTVKPRFTAVFGGKEISAVNRGQR